MFDYCVPIYDTLNPTIKEQWTDVTDKFKSTESGKTLMDVYDARWTIIGGVLLAVLTTFGYIKFMDWCAYWLSWLSVILVFASLAGSGAYAIIYRKDRIE